MAIVAFFSGVWTRSQSVIISLMRQYVARDCCTGAEGWYNQMQQLRLLLRDAPNQIKRRFARFVVIAAASLPDVGA